MRKRQRELPREVLTHEEVQRLIAACNSLRDRALVHVCYEGGLRAGEVLGLKIGDVQFDRLGAVVVVRGKTGMRRVRLIESVPASRGGWRSTRGRRSRGASSSLPRMEAP